MFAYNVFFMLGHKTNVFKSYEIQGDQKGKGTCKEPYIYNKFNLLPLYMLHLQRDEDFKFNLKKISTKVTLYLQVFVFEIKLFRFVI